MTMIDDADLDDGMKVGDAVQHRLPGRHVADVQQVLRDVLIGSLESGLDARRRLVCELDRHLYTDNACLS